jgi:hypothetical protein
MELNGGTLEELARDLGLPPFDILLVGDGSGGTVENSCGWCAVSYTRKMGVIELFFEEPQCEISGPLGRTGAVTASGLPAYRESSFRTCCGIRGKPF